MERKLNGTVIVLTGASSGFGKGAALRYARAGASLVLCARRKNLLEDLVAECNSLGGTAESLVCDVSKEDEVEKLSDLALERFGKFDVWVNNAGAGAIGNFVDIPLYDHRQLVESDLLGTLYGSWFALKFFENQGYGTLINVGSVAGKVPIAYYASYSAAKFGVVGLTAALRQEFRDRKLNDIHICTVLPVSHDTPFFEHAANYSGREPLPIPPVDDAQKVVDALFDLVFEPKDEVPVGKMSATTVAMENFAPGVVEPGMAKNVSNTLFKKAPASPATDGNLISPGEQGSGLHSDKK